MSVVLREMVLVIGNVVLVYCWCIVVRIYACYGEVGVLDYSVFCDVFCGKFVVVFESGISWVLWVL